MNTSVRVLGIALAVLMLAARVFGDEIEDPASRRTPSQGDNVAEVVLIVPEDAEVWFDGKKTRQTGSHRTFWSPVLTPGKTYSYKVKARWLENGRSVEQTRTIDVSANCISRVDFAKPKREPIAPHRGNLQDAAFSPDGKLLATAGGEQRIILWALATLRRLGEFRGSGPLAFSPDSKLLAGSRQDDSVRVWDVSSRQEVRRLPAPRMASCLAFAHGGRELAMLDAFSGRLHNRLVLWDVKTGRSVFTSEEVPPGSGTVVFSPDGRWLAVGGGQPRARRDDEPDPKPRPRAIQPSIVILDAASGRLRRRVQGEYSTYQLRYTPDGKMLIASGGPQPITLWDAHTGRLLGKFGRFQGGAHGLTLTSDGRTLVYEEGSNWVCVRRLDGQLVRRWHVPVRASQLILALSPDDRTLLTGGLQDPGFRLWDITTGEEQFPTQRPPARRP
ncbi:MAG TPA: TIGR03000 domain-containing protein [Gemmataceae bacterium]|nr:TIGR03000 domain-containing protein [Gemmataceae bacterium]